MKGIDNHMMQQLKRQDEAEHNYECIVDEMRGELERLGYTQRQIEKLDRWIQEQANKCAIAMKREFEPLMPHEWIEAEDEDGTIDEMLFEST